MRCSDVSIVVHDLCELHRTGGSINEIDVAVTRTPFELDKASEPLFEERFVALLAEDHPLASRESVSLAELAAEPLLLFERYIGPSVYDKILSLWTAAG